MKIRDKIIFSIIFLLSFFYLLYAVKSILAPFLFSLIIAYFLDPAVDLLQKKFKLSRLGATLLIFFGFFTLILILSISLMPIIYGQFIELIEALPQYFKTVTNDFYPKAVSFLDRFGVHLEHEFSDLLANQQISDQLISIWHEVFSNAVDSSKTVLNILSLLFIAPILIFYLLKDWHVMLDKINLYLPRNNASTIKQIAFDIDKTLSGYVRGQFNVCIILATIYSILLTTTGLNFGFLIGLITGLLVFIPFIGMLCGVTIATIVGLFQWGPDLTHALAITAVFVFGQIIESNFLTPKLIGSKIGLHPVWVIFGLFFFGSLFGFVGVLLSVPATAISGVLVKHFAMEYKKKFT